MTTQHLTANDLMIGDLVRIAPEENLYDKVRAVYPSGVALMANSGHLGDIIKYKDLFPIPLTPEILEKNGFKQTDKGGETCILGEWWWGDKGKRNFTIVTITFYKGLNSGVRLLTKIETDCSYESGINMIHSCDIESVHELLHALKLCGIEKEIEL